MVGSFAVVNLLYCGNAPYFPDPCRPHQKRMVVIISLMTLSGM
jgi:hypothetical protein